MITIDGVVVSGLRFAGSVSIPAQVPCFERGMPELAGVHFGTINLRLDRRVRIDNPDREFACVWNGYQEVFGFLEIRIEFPIGGESRQAWIYIPHGSPHREDRWQVEILAKTIEGLSYGSRCRINLPRGTAELDCIVVA